MSRKRNSSEEALRDQIERMAHRNAAINAVVDDYTAPLGAPAWMLLRLVRRLAPVRASDLATASRLSRPSVSRFIAALEREDLVQSDPDPLDGRASLISLSGHGNAYLDHLAEIGAQRIHELTDGFTVEEVEVLSRLLHRLNDNADQHTISPARFRFERLTQ